jgi:hypothetical protein
MSLLKHGEDAKSPESSIRGGSGRPAISLSDLIVIGLLLLLFLATWKLGAAPTLRYGHDLFAALDAGWRAYSGQRPHVDFYCPYGAAVPLLLSLGMLLSHQTAASVGVASAIAGLCCSLLAYRTAKRTLIPVFQVLVPIFVFLLAAAPSCLGEVLPSNAMYYTRWSFGLLAVILLECMMAERSGLADGVSTGLALALLFFLKLNMFFVGLGILIPSLVLLSRRARLKGMTLGTASAAVVMSLYLKMHLAALWHDYGIILHAKAGATPLASVLLLARSYWAVLVCLLLLAVPVRIAKQEWRGRVYFPLMAFAVFAADMLSLATNNQGPSTPLSAFFALICVSQLVAGGSWKTRAPSNQFLAPILKFLLVLCGGLFVLSFACMDAVVYYQACVIKVKGIEPPLRFATASFSDYETFGNEPGPDGRPTDGVFLVAKVNDGLDLLSQNSTGIESVAVLDFVNPFSFGLKRSPNRGGAVYLAYQNDFNDEFKPDPAFVLGTADLVMIPRSPGLPTDEFEAVLRNYGPYLQLHFEPSAESAQWIMWRHRKGDLVLR